MIRVFCSNIYFVRLVDNRWIGLGSRDAAYTCSNSNDCGRSFSRFKLHLPAKSIAAMGKPCLGAVIWGVPTVSDLACLDGCFWWFILREDSFG